MKVYYDTVAAIAFMSRRITNVKYSPFNKDIEPYISFLTLEEALHVLFAQDNYKKWYENLDEKEAYRKFIQDIFSTYRFVKDINNYEISIRILQLIKLLNESYNYIEKIKPKDRKYPQFMDLTHIVIAEKFCDVFVTEDHGFKKLEKIKNNLKIKKIVIMNFNTLSIDYEITK